MLKNLDGDWSVEGAATHKSGTVFFNLCHYTETKACSSKDDAFAYRLDDAGQCEMLTSDSP